MRFSFTPQTGLPAVKAANPAPPEVPPLFAAAPPSQPRLVAAPAPLGTERLGAVVGSSLAERPAWFLVFPLALLDFVLLLGCGFVGILLRATDSPTANFTLLNGVVIAANCGLGLLLIGGYDPRRDLSTLRYASEHTLAMIGVILASFLATYSIASYNHLYKPGRSVLLVSLVLFAIFSLGSRYTLSRRLRRRNKQHPVHIIGTRPFASGLETICHDARFPHPLRFIELSADDFLAVEGTASSAFALEGFRAIGAGDTVILDLPPSVRLSSTWETLWLHLSRLAIPVYSSASFVETHFRKIDLAQVTLHDALDGTYRPDCYDAYGKAKALLDRVLAALLLVAAAPVFLLIALLIWLDNGGPVLFGQARIGRFEQPFRLYKFRTMKNRPLGDLQLYTQKDDARITRLGRLLRLTRIDELPQLWNVVRGEMSLIGPRAEWDRLVEHYKREIPFYSLRFTVRPGITGWAQVNFGYGGSVEDSREKLKYDLYYIKHYSPQMDASIVLKTIYTMLSASGR